MKGWTSDHLAGLEQGAPAPAQRTNRANDGRSFEEEVTASFDAYARRGIATGNKVTPPVRILWIPDKQTGVRTQRVIQMKNPYLDFLSVWTAKYGRAIFLEAKSTATHRLLVNRDNGLKEHQVANMFRWRRAGAAVCLLWRFDSRCCLFTPEMVQTAIARGDKSLVFAEGLPVPSIAGLWDFLPVLEAAIWPA